MFCSSSFALPPVWSPEQLSARWFGAVWAAPGASIEDSNRFVTNEWSDVSQMRKPGRQCMRVWVWFDRVFDCLVRDPFDKLILKILNQLDYAIMHDCELFCWSRFALQIWMSRMSKCFTEAGEGQLLGSSTHSSVDMFDFQVLKHVRHGSTKDLTSEWSSSARSRRTQYGRDRHYNSDRHQLLGSSGSQLELTSSSLWHSITFMPCPPWLLERLSCGKLHHAASYHTKDGLGGLLVLESQISIAHWVLIVMAGCVDSGGGRAVPVWPCELVADKLTVMSCFM